MRAKWHLVAITAVVGIGLGFIAILLLARSAQAHCDTMDGPVVKDAKRALSKRDVTPVLKWIQPRYEKEVKAAFAKALTARGKDPKASARSDLRFFETLVRLHRAGEGEPFAGLKPAGQVEPIVAASDQALDRDSVDRLVKLVTDDVAAGIRRRFARASVTRKRADNSVLEGREYVEAYVEYVHYVERLHRAATAKGGHHGEGAEPRAESHRQ
jgi:hypothetical protein